MFTRMRTKTSDLITHKDFRVLLMMIGHKSLNKINLFKNERKKIKWRWLWNSEYILLSIRVNINSVYNKIKTEILADLKGPKGK